MFAQKRAGVLICIKDVPVNRVTSLCVGVTTLTFTVNHPKPRPPITLLSS